MTAHEKKPDNKPVYAEKIVLDMDIDAIQENENESLVMSPGPNNEKQHRKTGKTLQERFANDGFSDISTIKNVNHLNSPLVSNIDIKSQFSSTNGHNYSRKSTLKSLRKHLV